MKRGARGDTAGGGGREAEPEPEPAPGPAASFPAPGAAMPCRVRRPLGPHGAATCGRLRPPRVRGSRRRAASRAGWPRDPASRSISPPARRSPSSPPTHTRRPLSKLTGRHRLPLPVPSSAGAAQPHRRSRCPRADGWRRREPELPPLLPPPLPPRLRPRRSAPASARAAGLPAARARAPPPPPPAASAARARERLLSAPNPRPSERLSA